MLQYEFFIESANNKFDNGEITLEQYRVLTQMINERHSTDARINTVNGEIFGDYIGDINRAKEFYKKEYRERLDKIDELNKKKPTAINAIGTLRHECEKILKIQESIKETERQLYEAFRDFDGKIVLKDVYNTLKVKRNPHVDNKKI